MKMQIEFSDNQIIIESIQRITIGIDNVGVIGALNEEIFYDIKPITSIWVDKKLVYRSEFEKQRISKNNIKENNNDRTTNETRTKGKQRGSN